MAELITHWSFSKISPTFGTFNTLARSWATEGFSAMTRDLEPGAAVTVSTDLEVFLRMRRMITECQASVTSLARRGSRRAR